MCQLSKKQKKKVNTQKKQGVVTLMPPCKNVKNNEKKLVPVAKPRCSFDGVKIYERPLLSQSPGT